MDDSTGAAERAGLLQAPRARRDATRPDRRGQRHGERIGPSTMFVSERFNTKDAPILCRRRRGCAQRVARHRHDGDQPQHPSPASSPPPSRCTDAAASPVAASSLGLGRGFDMLFGLGPRPASPRRSSTDSADLHTTAVARRGRSWDTTVRPAAIRCCCLDPSFDAHLPTGLTVTAIGKRTRSSSPVGVASMKSCCTPSSPTRPLGRSVADGAKWRRACRSRSRCRRGSGRCLATVGDHLPEELRLKKLVGRLATYLQGYGDLMVRANDWDPEAVASVPRRSEFIAGVARPRRERHDPSELKNAATLHPRRAAARAGDRQRRSAPRRVRWASSTLAADGVIMHGATPAELEPVVAAYRGQRPTRRFDDWPANPGASRT